MTLECPGNTEIRDQAMTPGGTPAEYFTKTGGTPRDLLK